MHASTLTPKAEGILRYYVARAEKKYSIGSGWLSQGSLSVEITCSKTNDLIRRSLLQNDPVFSSEGLTLLSLDPLYTFKCQLNTYSRTLSNDDLTSAVNQLHRLTLAQNGRRITKGYLMRSYEWLGVSLTALVDVNEGYKIAFGGQERKGGIVSEMVDSQLLTTPPLKSNFHLSMPPPKLQKMKLTLRCAEEVEVGESAQGREKINPTSCGSAEAFRRPRTASALERGEDGFFRLKEMQTEDKGPHLRGPHTPNGFEDITPVTRGEWCFLMVGDDWKGGRTAPVEIC